MRKFLYAVASLLLILIAKPAYAQCWHPNYSTYTNRSVSNANSNPDPTLSGAKYTLHKTVEVTGITTFGAGCDIMEFSAQHWAQVKNIVGSAGGTTLSQRVCAGCYLDYSTSVSLDIFPNDPCGPFSPIGGCSDTTDTQLDCSVAGLFSDSQNIFTLEIAYTKSKNLGVVKTTGRYPDGTPYNVWLIGSYCTASTTPPDFHPDVYSAPAYYSSTDVYFIYAIAACIRAFGLPWICDGTLLGLVHGNSLGFPQSSPPPISSPGTCTYNP